jgi:hypothetical protein
MGDETVSFIELILLIAATLGVGKVVELSVGKFLNRKIDVVAEDKARADIAKTEVDTIRAVLEEVKEHSATKDKRIDKLETDYALVIQRVFKLEERERHQLTRAAAHESWDQMSFALLSKHFPEHPPPPPLTPAYDDTHVDPSALPYVHDSQEGR